jgi:hypothetical protein
MENMAEVCGEPLSARWLLPCFDSPRIPLHQYTSLSQQESGDAAPPAPRIDMV